VLELGSFLNNDRWTVQVGVGYKTENKMCNVHLHNVVFIEFILFYLTSINRRPSRSVQEPTDRIASLSLTSDH